MELFEATYTSSLETLCATQKSEYRAFLIALYEECQLRLAGSSDQAVASRLDGKEIVSTVANRVRRRNPSTDASLEASSPDQPTPNSDFSSSASEGAEAAGLVSAAGTSPPQKNEDSAQLFRIKSITDMGFNTQQAQTALLLANQNTEMAIILLIEQPEKIAAAIANPPPRRSSKQNQELQSPRSPGRASQPTHRPPARQPSLPSLVRQAQTKSSQNQKIWSPISFLKEQKQAMENTNIPTVKKLSGWIGKAMEGLGIDEDGRCVLMPSPLYFNYLSHRMVFSPKS